MIGYYQIPTFFEKLENLLKFFKIVYNATLNKYNYSSISAINLPILVGLHSFTKSVSHQVDCEYGAL